MVKRGLLILEDPDEPGELELTHDKFFFCFMLDKYIQNLVHLRNHHKKRVHKSPSDSHECLRNLDYKLQQELVMNIKPLMNMIFYDIPEKSKQHIMELLYILIKPDFTNEQLQELLENYKAQNSNRKARKKSMEARNGWRVHDIEMMD